MRSLNQRKAQLGHMTQSKHKKYQAYAAATQTVARTKQIVMLYDGVIRFVQQAKDAIREKRIEDRYKLLVKATDIITGLQTCLDFENGGDIAKLLFNFYTGVSNRIFSIHRTNSLETCDEVIADIKQMRDVWHEIDQSNTDSAACRAMPMPRHLLPPATPTDVQTRT